VKEADMRTLVTVVLGLSAALVLPPTSFAIEKDVRIRIIDPAPVFEEGPPQSPLMGVTGGTITWLGADASGTSVVVDGVWDFDNRGTLACPLEDGFQEYIKNGAFAQGWTSELLSGGAATTLRSGIAGHLLTTIRSSGSAATWQVAC
jgi:hypothetical protein